MRAFRSILLARLLVGGLLLGFLSGAVGSVADTGAEHPRQVWQRALADGTVERAVLAAQEAEPTGGALDAQVAAFLEALTAAPGGARLVEHLVAVSDPADVLRALLRTSQMGAPGAFGLADAWWAPAPPATTLGAPGALAVATPPALADARASEAEAPLPQPPAPLALRDRFPAVQPLGP